MVLGLEGCVSTKFFERLDLFLRDYSAMHVINKIITQADLRMKSWYSSSSLFGIWGQRPLWSETPIKDGSVPI